MKKKITIGIIGFGNIGKKRYDAINSIKKYDFKIKFIVDKSENIKISNVNIYKNIEDIKNFKVDIVFLCTPSIFSKSIFLEVLKISNVIVEKPLSIKSNFINKINKISKKYKKIYKIGYNLRFDDGLIKAKKIFDQGLIGKIYYIKMTYANGATLTNSNNVGALKDMGTHCINLINWFVGSKKFTKLKNFSHNNEFKNKKLEDNGFIILTYDKLITTIHYGFCTWKNNFQLEISGNKGLIRVDSLSKWGDQKISYFKRTFPDGVPNEKKWFYKKDNSWKNEILYFIDNLHPNFPKHKIEASDMVKIFKKL